jgi:hypothetical protein
MKLGMLLILFLLLSPFVYAQWPADSIIEALEKAVFSSLKEALKLFTDIANLFLAYNPLPLDELTGIYQKILQLLAPLYLLTLTWNGIQIMVSDSISQQVNARITIQNSVISMVLVAYSLYLYKGLLSLSQAVSSYFLTAPLSDPGYPSLTTLALFVILMLVYIMFTLILLIRSFLIALGVVLFPVGIFLYFFSPTKAYGRLILSMIFLALFVQIIFSLVFSVMELMAATPPHSADPLKAVDEQMYKLCIFIGGLLMATLVPLLIAAQAIYIALYPEIKLYGFLRSLGGSSGSVASEVSSDQTR